MRLWSTAITTITYGIILIVIGLAASSCEIAGANCLPDTVGLPPPDPLQSSRAPFLGRAIGETFYSSDTLLTRITVWRPAGNLSVIGAHLFITAVDTTVSPRRPDTRTVLLDGPTIQVYDSTPPGGVIEMPFLISPPLALPRPGYYAWFLQAEACNQGEPWIIAADETNPYPDGIYWITGRATTSCFLALADGGEDNTDLLFRAEFCNSHSTAVRGQSWGDLKLIYR